MELANKIFKGGVLDIQKTLILILVVSCALVVSVVATNPVQIGISLLVFLVFSLWGHVVVWPLYYKNLDVLNGVVWGSISGITIASLITSIIVYLDGWNLPLIFCLNSALPAVVLMFQFGKKKAGCEMPDTGSHRALVVALLCSLIIVTLFFFFPYRNLGVLVGGRYLYAWLFGHDFINRLVHVGSLSKGMPLDGMFFSGEKLSYYWLAYVYPALLHNMKSVTLELQQLLQLAQFYYSILTTAALILFLKKHIQERNIFTMAVLLSLCCYSYVWLLNAGVEILKVVSRLHPLVISESILNFSGFSHGFYRFFLVEPQAILAIGIMLMIFSLYGTGMTTYQCVLVGGLLGLLFGVEATNGIMLMLWFGGMALYHLLTHKQARFQVGLKHVVSVACALLVYAVLFSIKMFSFSTGKGALQLSPNWFALKAGIAYFPLAYGPPFVLGMAGLIRMFKSRGGSSHWVAQYAMLLGVGLFFACFIQNPTEYHFGLLKATRIIPISLLMLTVYFLQNRSGSQKIGKGVVILVAFAFPSIVSDNIIASDIANPSTFVRSADMEAARWIRKNIPPGAIVQADPNYPGVDDNGDWPKYAYSFIPIFAQRKTAVGEWKVSSQEHRSPEEVAERFHAIKRMYSTDDLRESLDIVNKYGINYIYVGELEKRVCGNEVTKFNNNLYFDIVYRLGNITIYKVINNNLL